jgi:hypothetical protein
MAGAACDAAESKTSITSVGVWGGSDHGSEQSFFVLPFNGTQWGLGKRIINAQ